MKLTSLCAALLIFPALAMAGVNTKNGNFYISYAEIKSETGGHELELTRTYNSKSTGIGWFGYGWGTPFEARVLVMPDGSVVVQENGGSGQENYYAPPDNSKLQDGVDRIVAAAVAADHLDAEAADALRKKLLADESARRANVLKYGIETRLQPGDKAQGSDCEGEFVTRIKDEYRRTTCGSGVDYFDLKGRLMRREDGDYSITVHYAGNYPDSIEDSLGQKLFLKWTAAGHVAEARTDKPEPVVRYYYDEQDNLLKSNTIGGNFYKYEYDANHNLTRIGYIDGTHMDMQYDANSLVTSVTDTDGLKTSYAYREEPGNPAHYWTTTTTTNADGEPSTLEEEFRMSTDASGVERLASLSRSAGQRKKDITLDEKGRVKRIRNPDGGFSEFSYHPTLNKISSVLTDEGRTDFQYDKAGNMVRAKNDHGQLITLGYDAKNRVIRLVDISKRQRRELTFKYNSSNKPTKITLRGMGTIDIQYDDQGEISEVKSRQGAKMAIAVSDAMMTLMQVVRVAGVDFGI